MQITLFNKYNHLEKCNEIYNEYALDEGIPKPIDTKEFSNIFCSEHYNSLGVVCCDKGDVLGFAFGTVTETVGYISYVGVGKKHRKKGIGKKLLSQLESEMLSENPKIERFDCMFYNPCQLSWLIPNNNPHSHPGMPGVDMESVGYSFFKNVGYKDYAIQNAYYMPLSELNECVYTVSSSISAPNNESYSQINQNCKCKTLFCEIEKRKKQLLDFGIEICFYDEKKHFGMNELFDNIKNEGWRKSVMNRLDEPIVVAVFNYNKCSDEYKEKLAEFKNVSSTKSLVIGYSGPLSLADDGRGLFCGIGVHTSFRGAGIGKVIFYNLCVGLKNMGGKYMSLFTGENNSARFIYEGVGFKVVRRFSCMRKLF